MTMNWHGIHHGSSWSYKHEKTWKAMFLNGTKVFDDCQTYHGLVKHSLPWSWAMLCTMVRDKGLLWSAMVSLTTVNKAVVPFNKPWLFDHELSWYSMVICHHFIFLFLVSIIHMYPFKQNKSYYNGWISN